MRHAAETTPLPSLPLIVLSKGRPFAVPPDLVRRFAGST
jgi:hypothetical protein